MKSKTVWFLTIFLALSTLKNIPLYKIQKLALNPLYIFKLSIYFFVLILKYFPVLPISTYPVCAITFLNLLFKKNNNVLGFYLVSKTFTFLIVTLNYPVVIYLISARG